MVWRRVLYDLMFRFGTPRWDTNSTPPEVVTVIEGGAAFPPGRALDLGCGTGTNVIYLAQHRWVVIGVEFSPLAIQQARKRAGGIHGAAFVEGDLSQLSHLGIVGPFDFVLDIGCFHSLSVPARRAYAHEVARVTRSGALFMIWAIASTRRPLLPGVPAMQDEDIAEYFGRDAHPGARAERQRALEGELVYVTSAVGSCWPPPACDLIVSRSHLFVSQV